MKKLVSVLLTAALLCGVLAVGAAAMSLGIFPDEDNYVTLCFPNDTSRQLELYRPDPNYPNQWLPLEAGTAVAWSSSAPAVVTVDQNGVITAQAQDGGTAVITATSADGWTATVTVTVIPEPVIIPPTPVQYPPAYTAALEAINGAFNAWRGTLEAALPGDEYERLSLKYIDLSNEWDNGSTAIEDGNWDAALRDLKAYFAKAISLFEDNSKNIKAPDSLWALVGGRPSVSAVEKVFDLFASFLPESVANVVAAIVTYVFFGWLWGRWL